MNISTTIICRCEEVTLEEITNTLQTYQCSPRELKLRTRAGMGYCGGRTCRNLMNTIFSETIGNEVAHQIPLKHQPPVRPVTFGILGGGGK